MTPHDEVREAEILVHTCHENCDNPVCLLVRERDALKLDKEMLARLLQVARQRRASYKSQLQASKEENARLMEALEYIAWPGMDRDHWDRVNKAQEALKGGRKEE